MKVLVLFLMVSLPLQAVFESMYTLHLHEDSPPVFAFGDIHTDPLEKVNADYIKCLNTAYSNYSGEPLHVFLENGDLGKKFITTFLEGQFIIYPLSRGRNRLFQVLDDEFGQLGIAKENFDERVISSFAISFLDLAVATIKQEAQVRFPEVPTECHTTNSYYSIGVTFKELIDEIDALYDGAEAAAR